ncbi:hypothetical protein Isop_3100 [Isosphaera pallida ATCC 43644]|uniref:Uncharacterized protein n=1 Tax=Isosphaera pallida (strain ATCC 43644 / DSM 9630 / IS1B) TaxID=575540 RepID=E8R3F5_ISOPI|nr:hypothetical protein Isop_3100 [Isosphaera pallida ATCC 43644]
MSSGVWSIIFVFQIDLLQIQWIIFRFSLDFVTLLPIIPYTHSPPPTPLSPHSTPHSFVSRREASATGLGGCGFDTDLRTKVGQYAALAAWFAGVAGIPTVEDHPV